MKVLAGRCRAKMASGEYKQHRAWSEMPLQEKSTVILLEEDAGKGFQPGEGGRGQDRLWQPQCWPPGLTMGELTACSMLRGRK